MIVYLLAAFGLAYIVGHSKISLGFRRWLGGVPEKQGPSPGNFTNTLTPRPGPIIPGRPGKLGPLGDFLCDLIECPACFGFWIGLVTGIALVFGLNPFNIELAPGTAPSWWLPPILGCITSGVNFITARATGLTPPP